MDEKEVFKILGQFPHCDARVLHAPKKCEFCDRHPDWQAMRILLKINFTGETDPGKMPCPATFHRPVDTINAWHGNRPSPVAKSEPPLAACRHCGSPLVPENLGMADGCPCNSGRGINHGLVPKDVCTCTECDPAQTGSSRITPPVDRSARDVIGEAVSPGYANTEDRGDGQQKGYVVLSDEERSKGFVRPVRESYVHTKCGQVTTMGHKLAETYARDPRFYSGTFCATCRNHFPVGKDGEFVWHGTNEKVGT